MTVVVRLAMAVVVVWALVAYGFLLALHPVAALLVASHSVVAGVALWGRHRIAAALREVNGWLAEDMDARKLAEQRVDRNFLRLRKAARR